MRPLLKLLAAIATVFTLTATVALTLLAARIGAVAGKARPEPQAIKLADLVKNGPGDNLHVSLNDFSFGAPIADQFSDDWTGAWVPLYPGHRSDGTPPALYFSRRTKSRAELDEILKQETLNALVASSITDSALKFEPAAAVYTAFPKLDPQKTVVLTEPELALPGAAVLPAQRWFDPVISYIAWAAALGMLGVGILCAYTSYRLNRISREEAENPPPPKLAALSDPSMISVHRFTLEQSQFAIFALGLAMIVMFIIGCVLIPVAIDMARANEQGGALLMGAIGIFMPAGGVVLAIKLYVDYGGTIREVAVLNGGLRWLRKNRVYNSSWGDIKSVFKKDLIYVGIGGGPQRGHEHTLTLRLNDGRVLNFNSDTLEDYDQFAEAVLSF